LVGRDLDLPNAGQVKLSPAPCPVRPECLHES